MRERAYVDLICTREDPFDDVPWFLAGETYRGHHVDYTNEPVFQFWDEEGEAAEMTIPIGHTIVKYSGYTFSLVDDSIEENE